MDGLLEQTLGHEEAERVLRPGAFEALFAALGAWGGFGGVLGAQRLNMIRYEFRIFVEPLGALAGAAVGFGISAAVYELHSKRRWQNFSKT